MLSKRHRISNPRLIIKLAKQGEVKKTKDFVFKHLPSPLGVSKFAISLSKKNIPKATQRNRLKRQIYDALRRNLKLSKASCVCLIIQKKGHPQKIDYNDLEKQIQQFFNAIK